MGPVQRRIDLDVRRTGPGKRQDARPFSAPTGMLVQYYRLVQSEQSPTGELSVLMYSMYGARILASLELFTSTLVSCYGEERGGSFARAERHRE
jgi:hypothetical protein